MGVVMGSPAMKVERSGDNILVDGESCDSDVTTISNVSYVDIYDNAQGLAKATISLAGGPFAPGLGEETSPSAEIEFKVHMSIGCDQLHIQGGGLADNLRFGMSASGFPNVNLNAAETADVDADVTNQATFPICDWRPHGGPGGDTISGVGLAGTGSPWSRPLIAYGDGGADTLTGGTSRDEIRGGDNGDLIKGGLGSDKLYGEAGRDKLYGGPGNDLLVGGEGRDVCKGGPGRDTLKSCEAA